MKIRSAMYADLTQMLSIYNYEICNGVATFDMEEKTAEQWHNWFYSHNNTNHPVVVAEVDGVVAGYASLSEYRPRTAYRYSVELSVYIDADFRGKGVAKALIERVLNIAKERDDIHTVVSLITAENVASIRLHEKMGFDYCGKIRQIGHKHGRFLDVKVYQILV